PYVQAPWSGFGHCGGTPPIVTGIHGFGMDIGAPGCVMAQNYPNPVSDVTTFKYNLSSSSRIRLEIFDISGKKVATLVNNEMRQEGTYEVKWNVEGVANGVYIASLVSDGDLVQSMKVNVAK
ncbi:MAG TPA: T9SS type A sorting domain-containing protein, partial [Bacteroidia bacterium]|nr:T9SS type A sorting domain-containing protein [Bacteroidia bacterium]